MSDIGPENPAHQALHEIAQRASDSPIEIESKWPPVPTIRKITYQYGDNAYYNLLIRPGKEIIHPYTTLDATKGGRGRYADAATPTQLVINITPLAEELAQLSDYSKNDFLNDRPTLSPIENYQVVTLNLKQPPHPNLVDHRARLDPTPTGISYYLSTEDARRLTQLLQEDPTRVIDFIDATLPGLRQTPSSPGIEIAAPTQVIVK